MTLSPMELQERSVGLIKSLAARSLCTSGLDSTYWSYAVRYAAQSLLCQALQIRQKSLPFGASVVAQVLGHRDIKFPQPRSLTGRLLFWDHLHDGTSYVLCPPEDDVSDPLVHKASLPVKLPPAINVDELEAPKPLPTKKKFDHPLAPGDDLHDEPKDLDPDIPDDNDEDDDVILEQVHHASGALPANCTFSYLFLSSEDSSLPSTELEDLTSSNSLPPDLRKQGVTHINVTSEQVINSDGEERFKWMAAGRKRARQPHNDWNLSSS